MSCEKCELIIKIFIYSKLLTINSKVLCGKFKSPYLQKNKPRLNWQVAPSAVNQQFVYKAIWEGQSQKLADLKTGNYKLAMNSRKSRKKEIHMWYSRAAFWPKNARENQIVWRTTHEKHNCGWNLYIFSTNFIDFQLVLQKSQKSQNIFNFLSNSNNKLQKVEGQNRKSINQE